MNLLVENEVISEMSCGANFAYILNDNHSFLLTEYKVLQSQTSSCFVRCMKMLYNGKIQLYYLTDSYKPFSSLLPNLDAERFLTIVKNLLSDIIDVKSNGFLSCQNIDISTEHIYIDTTTYQVRLIYLPLSQRIYPDFSIFENELRIRLIQLISNYANLSSPKITQLSSDLSNGGLSIEDLSHRLKGSVSVSQDKKTLVQKEPAPSQVRIYSLNASARMEILVTKDEFILGTRPDRVDAVISFNKNISRVHCKINKNGILYTVTDLHSLNGTFLNNFRLKPEQPTIIKNGDILRLANSDFKIVIR